MRLWEELHHLFDQDDGSLPDISLKGLTDQEVEAVYLRVRSLTGVYGNSTLWSLEEEKDIPIRDIVDPVKMFLEGKAESFRHGLEGFEIAGTRIPQLTICVERGGVSFDYRMGPAWGPKEVLALFTFLAGLKELAPRASIVQADEGGREGPNTEFTEAFEGFCSRQNAS